MVRHAGAQAEHRDGVRHRGPVPRGRRLALIRGFLNVDGSTDESTVALVGVQFSDDLTGNGGFASSASLTAGFTVVTFALVSLARLDFLRWPLVAVRARPRADALPGLGPDLLGSAPGWR